MSKIEHTPGPWNAFYKSKYDEWHVSLPMTGLGMNLALCADGIQSENREADARLIATAPDLLEALKAAVATWERFYPLLPVNVEVEDAEFDQFSKARSVICKALGLEPWDYHKHVAEKAGAA